MVGLTIASFDESGKFADSEVVAFGGCIGSQDDMNEFCILWAQIIEPLNVPYVSMKDAMYFGGPFSTWRDTPERRDDLLRSLGRLIADQSHKVSRVAAVLTTAEFKAVPHDLRKSSGNPQYHAFEACVKFAHTVAPPPTALLVECDLSEEYAPQCLRLFNKMRRSDPYFKNRSTGILFSDDTRRAPLQVADMIAYCARADALRSKITPAPIVDELFHTLVSSRRQLFEFLGSLNELGRGVIFRAPDLVP